MKDLTLIAYGCANWDFYTNKEKDCVYYIAKKGSSAGSGIYCGSNRLLSNFQRMRQVKRYDTLIPPAWEVVDHDFFRAWGCIE